MAYACHTVGIVNNVDVDIVNNSYHHYNGYHHHR